MRDDKVGAGNSVVHRGRHHVCITGTFHAEKQLALAQTTSQSRLDKQLHCPDRSDGTCKTDVPYPASYASREGWVAGVSATSRFSRLSAQPLVLVLTGCVDVLGTREAAVYRPD